MAESNVVDMVLRVTPQGLELFDQAGKKVGDLGRAAKDAEQSFSLFSAKGAAASVAVAGLAAAATGFAVAAGAAKAGMDAFTAGVARGSAFNDLSQRLGVSVETLSKLELAAKTSGVSLDGLGSGIQQLSRNMVEAASGGKEAQAAFAALGISAAELKSLNTEQVLGKIADSFAGANDGAAKTTIAMQLLGRAGAQMIPLLNEGSAGLQRFGELSERLGLTMTQDMAAAFDSIGDSMDILGSAVEGVQSQFAIGMAPALAEVSEALVNLVADMGIANGTIRGLGENVGGWLKEAFDSLKGTIEETQSLFATLDFEDAMGIVGERLNKALESAFESAIWAAARAAKNVFMTAVEWAFGSVDISSVVASKNEELIREQVGNLERELSARYGAGGLEAARADAPFDANVRNLVENVDALKGRLGELAGAQLVAQAAASKNSAALVDQQVAGNLAALGINTAGDAWRFYEHAGESAGKKNLNAPLKDTGDAANKAAAALEKLRERFAEQIRTQTEAVETMGGQNEALQQIIDGNLSAADAQTLLNDATGEAAAAAAIATGATTDEVVALGDLAIKAAEAAQKNRELNATRTAQVQTQNLQQEAAILQQVIDGTKTRIQAEHELAVLRERQKGTDAERAEALVSEQEHVKKVRDEYEKVGQFGEEAARLINDAFDQTIDGLIAGTLDFEDVWKSLATSMAKQMIDSMGGVTGAIGGLLDGIVSMFSDAGGSIDLGALFNASGLGGGSSGGSTGGSLLNLLTSGGGGGAGSLLSLLGGAGGLLAGAGTGANNGTVGILTGLGATGAYSLFSKFAISNLGQDALALLGGETFAGTVGDFLGNAGTTWGGSLFGGANIAEGFGGGALGSIGSGLVSAGLNYGASVAGSATREALGVAGPYGTEGQILQTIGDVVVGIVGTYFGGPLLGALLVYINQILGPLSGELFGVAQPPTKGTMQRQAGESYLDAIPTFGNLQDSLGDVTRKFYRVEDAPWLPESREKLGPDTMRDIGGFAGIVAQIFGGEVDNGGRVAGMVEEWTNILTDFFGRMDQEGEETSLAIRQHLAQAFKEIGVDATDALEIVNKLAGNLLWSPGGTDTNYFGEEVSNVTNLGEAVRGTAAIFESEMPKGVHIAALALESMSRDGEKAFSDLDTTGHETLLNLADDAENFDAILAHLFEQGFTIDTEEFEARLKSITESAQFIGENIGQIFNFDNAAVGVEAIFQGLKQQVLGVFQQTSLDQLFKTTNIAAAFEPVYAALDRIDEFDLTTATGSQDFMNLLLPALAEGKANLQDYIPVLQLMADNWKEIQKIIDEAMKPDVFEQAAQVAEAGFNGIGGALTAAIEAGMVVLESGGTWDDAVSVFNNTFGAGVEKSFKDAIFNAIVQSAVIQPLIATFQPAFEYVVAAGLIYGFDNPKVREAFALLMGDVTSKAEKLGLIVFKAKVDSDGITSDIESAFNDAADITVDWANDFKGELSSALDSAFDVLRSGGSRDEAIAAWNEALSSGTYNSVLDAIARALIDAALLEPFIKKHAPEIQYITAGAIALGWDNPKVQEAIHKQFGPGSEFQTELKNIGPLAIDIYGTIVLPDGTRWSPGGSAPPGLDLDGEQSGGGTKNPGRRFPGAAKGGSFPLGQSIVVGENGPEFVTTGPDGITVTPLDAATASALIDPAQTQGRTFPGGDGRQFPSNPPSGGGRTGPHNPIDLNPHTRDDDFRTPTSRPRIPPPPGQHPGTSGVGTVDVQVELGLDEAIEAFLRGGSLKDFQDALDEGTKRAVLDGVIKGMLESGPIKNAIDAFNKQMDDAVTKAMRDGIIDAQDQADLAALSEKLSGGIETATKQMQPVVEAVGKAFGLGVEESTKEAIDGISSDLDGAIRTFLEGGSVTDMADEINRSVYDATTSAIIQALVTTGPLADVIDKFGSKVGKAISDALEDGTIDEKEARRIRRIGKKYGAEISDAIEALGPVLGPMFEQWAGELGLDLKGEIVSVEGLLGNAVRQGLLDGSSFDTFKQNVKQTLYEAIVDGMVQAFIDSAVINGLLAGPLGVINATFAQIADGQLTVAEANKIIFQQVGIITGLIDSPAFKAAWTVMTSGIDAIRASLGIATANVVDAAQGFTDVADAAQNACAGECEWERKLVEGQEKNATLDEYGRQGYEAVETYGPVKPGGDETDDPWADVPDTMGGGNGVYGHPSDLVGYWQRREMRKNRRRQRRLDGPSGPAWGEYPDDGDSTFGPVKYPRDDRDFVGPNAALQSGPMLVQDEGVAALRAEVASLRDAILNMPAPVVNLDGREISKNSRKHERRESRGAQSTQWGIS